MNRINAALLTLSLLLLTAAVVIACSGNVSGGGSGDAQESSDTSAGHDGSGDAQESSDTGAGHDGSGDAQESSDTGAGHGGNQPHLGSALRLLIALHSEPESDGGVAFASSLYEHWIDADDDGENTRQEVLNAESDDGTWHSWYDDQSVSDASNLEVDHLVPLAEAHESGAWEWTPEKRRAYANDLSLPQTLTAVSASSIEGKGHKDPAEWRPPAEAAWCQYARDWIAVKNHWGLSYDADELYALTAMLNTCEDDGHLPVPRVQDTPEHDHSATPTPGHSHDHSATPTPGHSHDHSGTPTPGHSH